MSKIKGETKLIFFGDYKNSYYGLIRGLISFFILLIIYIILYFADKDITFINKFLILIIFIFFVSALTVQVPYNSMDAIKYGFSVGLYTFGLFLILYYSTYNKINTKIILYSILGLTSFIFISVFIYLISKKYNFYPYLT